MSHAPTYLFIVYERGGVKTAGCPLEKVGRLLRSHINQHTLGHQECWQSYEKKKGIIHMYSSNGLSRDDWVALLGKHPAQVMISG